MKYLLQQLRSKILKNYYHTQESLFERNLQFQLLLFDTIE